LIANTLSDSVGPISQTIYSVLEITHFTCIVHVPVFSMFSAKLYINVLVLHRFNPDVIQKTDYVLLKTNPNGGRQRGKES